MTIKTNDVRNEYTANAGQTIFDYTFKIYANDELTIYITPSGQDANDANDITTSYAVDPGTIGNENGGFITYSGPSLTGGELVTIISGIPYDRTVDYQNNGDFRPETVNGDNDRQVSQIKQIVDLTGRTLQFPNSAQNQTSLSLPNPEAGLFMRWKDDLLGLENISVTDTVLIASGQLVIFNTVAAMTADISGLLVVGINVKTLGYYQIGDGGGSSYVVAAAAGADGSKDHLLQNGNDANLAQDDADINVLSYGANGDGVTNNDDSFASIEANNGHITINLNGGTYVLTSNQTGNVYFNGVFSVGGVLIKKARPVNASASPFVEDINGNTSLLYYFDNLLGPGGNSIGIQDIAFSESERRIYTLNLNGAGSGDLSTVNRFDMDGDVTQGSLGHSDPEGTIAGHQGLAVDTILGNVRLWSTSYGSKLQAVRYEYVDDAPLANAEIFTLFDGSEFETSTSCSPTVSYGQKYLIAYGTKLGALDITVRVWDLLSIAQGGAGDYSDDWIFEWTTQGLVDATHPTQGIASDGVYVWIIAGNNDINVSKKMHTYALSGEVLRTQTVTVGRDQALLDGAGTVYEPEGLSIFKNAAGGLMLCVGVISGDLGTRFVRVYGVGLDNPLVVDEVDILGNTRSTISNAQSAGRDFLSIRARLNGSTGAGLNIYGEDDSALPNAIGIVIGGVSSATAVLTRESSGLRIDSTGGDFVLSSSGDVELHPNSGSAVVTVRTSGVICNADTYPSTNNTRSLGTASLRWTEVFAVAPAINTSDERLKTDARKLTEAEKRIALGIKANLKVWKFIDAKEKKGDGARWHFGPMAQKVAELFAAEGLGAGDYGLFCYDEWDATPEVLYDGSEIKTYAKTGVDGNGDEYVIESAIYHDKGAIKTPAVEAGDSYGIRYEEMLAFIIAAM